jgi:large subunit ribosomal protein L5
MLMSEKAVKKSKEERATNPMRSIFIDKVIINIGTGSDEQKQKNAKKLIEALTGMKPTDSISKRRNPAFKIIKGTKIGAYVTVRKDADKLVKRLLEAVDMKVKESSVSNNTLSFGINEYIDINGIKYDPAVGMLGMNVNVSFRRKGIRVAERKIRNNQIPGKHRIILRDEIMSYLSKTFGASFV